MTAKQNGSAVTVEVNGAGFGKVAVDGVNVNCIQSVSATVNAGEAPVVKLGLAIRESAQLCYEGATLIIDGAVMPIDVELALWRFLRSKYERGVDKREIDVTTLESTARERALWFR